MPQVDRRRRRRKNETQPGPAGVTAAAGGALHAEASRPRATIPALPGEPRVELLGRAVERARILLLVLDPDGMILLAEGGGLSGLGLDAARAVGQSMLTTFGAENGLGDALARALAGEAASATIQREQREFELSFEPVGDQDPGAGLVLVVGTDVTAYRLALSAVRNREERLRSIMDTVLDGIVVFNDEGMIEGFNPAASRISGYSAGEVMGRKVSLLLPELDGGGIERALRAGRARQDHTHETFGQRKDGAIIPVDIAISELKRGARRGFIGSFRDLTARKAADEALRRSEERYALVAQAANDGLLDWDIEAGTVYFSPRWPALLGLDLDRLRPAPDEWFKRIHADDFARVSADIDAHLTGVTPHFESEYRIHHADGGWRWVVSRGMAVRRADGSPTRMVASLSDVTARKEAEQRVIHNATHDTLTGLPNRTLLLDRIDRTRAPARGSAARGALMVIDIDRFKVANESLGHSIGDQILVTLARRLPKSLAVGDTLARLSGDEFAVLVAEVENERAALALAERLRRRVGRPIEIGGDPVVLSASIGVVMLPSGKVRPADLLRDANLAMYQAKVDGGDRVRLFADDLRQRSAYLLRSETELRRGIETGRLSVHYQPLVSLDSGAMAGFEALARLTLPSGDMLPPGDFIPVAEQTGLIVPLGLKVLQQGCEQLRRWHNEYGNHLTMAINLSPRQLEDPEIVKEISRVLEQGGHSGFRLKLEITEGALINNPEVAATQLAAIRALGVQICIDDFGTGHSSLAYLHRFPIDVLKIDRFFIGRMAEQRRDLELVRGIVGLCHNLGVDVVAEGVETAEQAKILSDMGCEYGQGYLFGRPMSAGATAEWLDRHKARVAVH
ncbi:MAG TPA: EAL domain-containing protein [Candidatus Sulfotelmatobacter sp.]|nr:EAL domain-containing protein [Candidatus Sulfotelmatobacter sp.]